MARPRNKADTKSFELSVPLRLYRYLTYLAKHSTVGAPAGG